MNNKFSKRPLSDATVICLILCLAIALVAFANSEWRNVMVDPDAIPYHEQVERLLRKATIPDHGHTTSLGSYAPPGTAWLLLPGYLLLKDPRTFHVPGALMLYAGTLVGIWLLAATLFGRRNGVAGLVACNSYAGQKAANLIHYGFGGPTASLVAAADAVARAHQSSGSTEAEVHVGYLLANVDFLGALHERDPASHVGRHVDFWLRRAWHLDNAVACPFGASRNSDYWIVDNASTRVLERMSLTEGWSVDCFWQDSKGTKACLAATRPSR